MYIYYIGLTKFETLIKTPGFTLLRDLRNDFNVAGFALSNLKLTKFKIMC